MALAKRESLEAISVAITTYEYPGKNGDRREKWWVIPDKLRQNDVYWTASEESLEPNKTKGRRHSI